MADIYGIFGGPKENPRLPIRRAGPPTTKWAGRELLPRQPAPTPNAFKLFVDLGGIEPPSVQCECTVLPLYHRPIYISVWRGGENAEKNHLTMNPEEIIKDYLVK